MVLISARASINIREEHALWKILPKRVNQHETPFLIIREKLMLLEEIQGPPGWTRFLTTPLSGKSCFW
jgi:hypothetical protein